MFDVVSIGAASVDIFALSDDIRVQGPDLILPYSAKTEIKKSLICSGGGATNSAVSFARLGLNSACVSLLGDDLVSRYVYQDLKADGVTDKLLVSNKNDSTDFSIILVAPDGGRTILTNRGSTRLETKHIPWDKLKTARWLYLTSLEGNLNLLEQLVGFAIENHIKISLNPGARELNQRRQLIPLLKYVDFLLLNLTESEQLTQEKFSSSAFWPKIISYGSAVVAVTNGRDGAYVYARGNHFYSPVINSHPLDETGAGDSFGSAFVAALAHNLSPQEALFWGIKNSASVVSYLGAKTGLLSLRQINNKIKSLPKLQKDYVTKT